MAVASACTGADDTAAQSTTTEPAVAGSSLSTTTSEPVVDAQTALSALAGLPGQLVVRDQAGSIVLSSADGTELTTLAHGSTGIHTQPTWSLEGDQLSWSSVTVEGPELTTWARDTGETTSTALASPPFYHSWAPGGSRLATLRPTIRGIELGLHEIDDASHEPLGIGQPFYFDWFDDASGLVAAVDGTDLREFSLETASGDPFSVRPVDIDRSLGVFQTPLVLPDRDVVVPFTTGRDHQIELARIRGGQLAESIAFADSAVSMTATAAGDRIAVLVLAAPEPDAVLASFQSDDVEVLPTGRVSVVDLDTGDVSTLDDTAVAAMSWSPDGRRLALLTLETGQLRWVFTGEGEVVRSSAFQPSERFATNYLPFADQYAQSSTWWSPDSAAFVFTGTLDGQSGVFVDLVDDDAGAIRVASGDIAFWSPS